MAGWSFHPACFYRLKILKAPAPACPSLPHKYRSVRSAGCRGTPKPKPSISKAEKEKSPARPRSLLSGLLFKHGNGFHGHWKASLARVSSARRNRPREHIFRGTWGKPACPHKCARWLGKQRRYGEDGHLVQLPFSGHRHRIQQNQLLDGAVRDPLNGGAGKNPVGRRGGDLQAPPFSMMAAAPLHRCRRYRSCRLPK